MLDGSAVMSIVLNRNQVIDCDDERHVSMLQRRSSCAVNLHCILLCAVAIAANRVVISVLELACEKYGGRILCGDQ